MQLSVKILGVMHTAVLNMPERYYFQTDNSLNSRMTVPTMDVIHISHWTSS